MTTIALLIFTVVVALFGSLAAFAWFGSRKRLREAKNYERGLKMVPMLIHLPPGSDDTDIGSRDSREVVEETVSKAQILYDIIASTFQKGFKSKFYGQRHISFEIVAKHGRVHFYTAVPVVLAPIVQQAILSAYPTARLEEVEEHNIFSPVGRISGTIGGELNLKEDYIMPIATYQDTKRDAVQSLLNSLSELGDEDGAGIQIMLRPARSDWHQRSIKVAKEKKEGKKSGGNFGALSLLWKAPEQQAEKAPKQLSNLEQSQIDAIENKTKYAAYETLVRVVASSNTIQQSQRILNNMVATFALFDAPGKNGFKYSEAKDIESFVTAYILRFFPPEVNKNVLNSVELATLFHFPDQAHTPTSQLERQASKQVDGPRGIPHEGLLLGYNVFRGIKKEIRLTDNDRRRHLYIVGQTGTGKSTILENLALQDMINGKGFAFVDPHGDTVELLMGQVPKERIDDVIYFSPADMDFPMGLNLFEFDTPDQKDFLIQEAINMLYKLYDPQHQGIIGPRYEHWFRNAALTLMSDPQGSTFIDIPKVFTDNQYAKDKLKYVTDQTVLDFWNKEMAQTSDYHKSEVLGWFVSKFGAFLSNEMMRNIIGQTQSAFNLRQIMDEGKILFVNLSKGRTGELNSKLLGMIFVMKFQSAAMSRANIPEDQRRDFSLYVDEFQNFSTDSFSSILSEARKYRLNLIVANQFISQLTDDIRDAVFGNVGSVVSFRTGASDADFLVKQFSPTFDADDLVRLPNFNSVARVMISNVPSQPFSMTMLPRLGHENHKLAGALKRMSSLKYGKPRAQVESTIFKRLQSSTPELPTLGSSAPRAGSMGQKPVSRPSVPALPGQPGADAAAARPSFLDEWLEKRKARMSSLQGTTGKPPAQPSSRLTQDVDSLFDKGEQHDPSWPDRIAAPAASTIPPPATEQAPPRPVAVPAPQASSNIAPATPVEPHTPQPSTPVQSHDSTPDKLPDVLVPKPAPTAPEPKKAHADSDASAPRHDAPKHPAEKHEKPVKQHAGSKTHEEASHTEKKAEGTHAKHDKPHAKPGKRVVKPVEHARDDAVFEDEDNHVAGGEDDKDDIKTMSEVLKASLKSKAEQASKQPDKDGLLEMNEDDDMYIDKDGNIHYRDDSPARH